MLRFSAITTAFCSDSLGSASSAFTSCETASPSPGFASTAIARRVVIGTSVTGSPTTPGRSAACGLVTPMPSSSFTMSAGELFVTSTMNTLWPRRVGCPLALSPVARLAMSSSAITFSSSALRRGLHITTSELLPRSTSIASASPIDWARGWNVAISVVRSRAAGTCFSLITPGTARPISPCCCSVSASVLIWANSGSSARTMIALDASSPMITIERGPRRAVFPAPLIANSSRIVDAIALGLPVPTTGITRAGGRSANPGTSSCFTIDSIRSRSRRPAKTISELVCGSADTVGRPCVSTSTVGEK